MKIILGLLALCCALSASAAAPEHWIVTWGASPSPQETDPAKIAKAKLSFHNQTIREIVHTSAGGDLLRVRLSNVFGKDAVHIGAAHLALRAKESAIAPGSDQVLTFSGRPTITIPPNAIVVSDPVKLRVAPRSDLAVSLFVPEETMGAGIHYSAEQTSYLASGDQTASASLPGSDTVASWVFLADVDVLENGNSATLAAFGDSITDGARSTQDANNRWPDILAGRLLDRKNGPNIGVLNAGIGGNRVLHDAQGNIAFGVSALARFDRDVLSQPGIRYVIVLEGINDLGHPGTSAPASETVTAEDIEAGLQQLAERAHEHGIRVYGATLTPFEGTVFPGYFSPEKEIKRKAINNWIRTTKVFDGVVDFDRTIRDPQHPDRVLPAFDGGDHLHPGDAGYTAMGRQIDLRLFQ